MFLSAFNYLEENHKDKEMPYESAVTTTHYIGEITTVTSLCFTELNETETRNGYLGDGG